MSPTGGHFGPGHPLAAVAARHCEQHGGRRGVGVGRVACGACWELAIRDDERFIIEVGLPRELPPLDPGFVDEIAVELACRGEPVALTRVERAEAAWRLRSRGLSVTAIARRLRASGGTAAALVAEAGGETGPGIGVAA